MSDDRVKSLLEQLQCAWDAYADAEERCDKAIDRIEGLEAALREIERVASFIPDDRGEYATGYIACGQAVAGIAGAVLDGTPGEQEPTR